MANIKKSITELIGHTPLFEISNIEKDEGLLASILVKLELFNPNQSIKDRIAIQIVEDAERSGKLKPGQTIVETTSGNTGIGLAGIAAAKGYKFRAYMQEQVSEERFKVIEALGGETIKYNTIPEVQKVLEEQDGDFVAAINTLKKKLRNDENIFFADQCYNYSNIQAHELTTGPEIWEDTDGNIDIVVASVGTGGTISGVGRYLKKKNPNIKIIAVEPGLDSRPTKENAHSLEITGIHAFKDAPEENIPKTIELEVIDEIVDVEAIQAFEITRMVARREGLLVGPSSGAALYHAITLAKKAENKGKDIVVIAPDTGLRYLSTEVFGNFT